MIDVIGLKKHYGGIKAVDGINFKAEKGEIVGLLGENGAGKTTTLRMLSTMISPTEGEALVNGFNICKDKENVRKQIGILFGGEVGLYDRLTGRENIKYFARLYGMTDIESDKRIEELAQELDMDEYIDRRVHGFSRGMKQKICIARAIVHSPEVMLLDEPSTGLDVTAARIVQDFMKKCRQQNKAIIFSSHSMKEVEKLCDRVIIINKGKMIEQGTIDELKTKYGNDDLEDVFISLIGERDNE